VILGEPLFFNVKKIQSSNLKSGPIFFEYCLIDEINRAAAKTTSCHVRDHGKNCKLTMDGTTYKMKHPLCIGHTKNPIRARREPMPYPGTIDAFYSKIKV